MTNISDELFKMTATEAVGLLRSKEVTPLDLVEASIKRIETVDPEVNSLPIHCFEQARDRAKSLDLERHASNPKSLCGLPIAVKDYNDLGGAVTTYGSPIFADNIAQKSDATVRKLENNGAIAIAKSNVPEWAGGHTFNPVNGLTRNPWDLSKSAGGSSGGSAAALASGLVWLATGNDLGGSLRTPAAFNGVVGLRPSPGRVPRGTRLPSMDTLWVEGPMARNVDDLALMLDAGVGHQVDDPLSFDHSGPSFVKVLKQVETPKRVAFSPDLSVVSMEKEIAEVCRSAIRVFKDIGTEVTDEIPDFDGVLGAFQTLRAVLFAIMMEPILEQHRDMIAPEIVGNIERGLNISQSQIFKAERIRIELFKKVLDFFETHDFLVCPAASIAPFPVDQRYITEIDGKPCETYIDWFSITFALTMTACPTISVPCGFTSEGLPVGIQIMGKPRGEAALLQVAKQFEQAIGISNQLPITPDEITKDAIAAAEAGAAILHLHARNPETGQPDQSPDGFAPFLPRIKQGTNSVINITTGGSPYMTVEERVEPAAKFKPEVASLNMGSMNFGLYPMLNRFKEFKFDWEREHLEGSRDLVFRNSFKDIEYVLKTCYGNGTRFEFECYDISHLYNLAHFVDRGLIKAPFFVQSVFGLLGGIGPHPEDVMHMKRTADRLFGSDYRWSVLGAGSNQFRVAAQAAALGGNVRVGLEDSIWAGKGELATSNAVQVSKVRQIIESLGLNVATPDEAREILSLKGGDQVNF